MQCYLDDAHISIVDAQLKVRTNVRKLDTKEKVMALFWKKIADARRLLDLNKARKTKRLVFLRLVI